MRYGDSWFALVVTTGIIVAGGGCNAISGAGDLEIGVVGDAAPETSDGGLGFPDATPSSPPTDSGGGPPVQVPTVPARPGWSYGRAVVMSSDADSTLVDYAVLVVFPKTFPYDHVKPNGDDLRFGAGASGKEELAYFVERWDPAGESIVWLKMPSIAPGQSSIFAYYGNSAAPPASSFETTFPKAQRTAGGGAGSIALSSDIDVDWFELRAGDTLTLAPGKAVKIAARRIVIAGNIVGLGAGLAGATGSTAAGSGPGAGQPAATQDAPGGAGYGGVGGHGGGDGMPGGAGGTAYGTADGDDIALGSGGGSSAARDGGAGGGAISLLGWRTTISGQIRVNGADGQVSTTGFGNEGGGAGSGGGILIGASTLELAGATLTANGGNGGNTVSAAVDGGGGGGGGRIKLRRRPHGSYSAPATMTAAFGAGGAGAATEAPGAPGAIGTTHVNESSTLLRGVETSFGPEESATCTK